MQLQPRRDFSQKGFRNAAASEKRTSVYIQQGPLHTRRNSHVRASHDDHRCAPSLPQSGQARMQQPRQGACEPSEKDIGRIQGSNSAPGHGTPRALGALRPPRCDTTVSTTAAFCTAPSTENNDPNQAHTASQRVQRTTTLRPPRCCSRRGFLQTATTRILIAASKPSWLRAQVSTCQPAVWQPRVR